MTDELDVETQRRHIRDMFRLLELKRLAAANAIDAAQQTELDDLQARTDAAIEAERATEQTDVARTAKPEKDEEP
jgi:hypothetical protein